MYTLILQFERPHAKILTHKFAFRIATGGCYSNEQELKTMQATPLEWATVELVDDSIMKWRAVVNGPVRVCIPFWCS